MQKDVTPPQFDARVEEWKKMDRSTDTKRKEASDFYDQELFPIVKEVFFNKYSPEKQYEGLILTVGFSPQPLILSTRAINPKRIALLYTPETVDFITRIQQQTGYTSDRTDLLKIDGTDVKGIYDKTWKFARDTWGDFTKHCRGYYWR